MGFRRRTKNKISNRSVPDNFIKKVYKNKVVEHSSAQLFCPVYFLARAERSEACKVDRDDTLAWLAIVPTTARVRGIPPFKPLGTMDAAIMFPFFNIVTNPIDRM